MAKTFPLTDVTSDAGQAAETLIIQLIRAQYPTLDLRRGTALRELLVRPAAALDAREIDRYDYLQLIRSLQLIANNPDDATVDDVNALLANYQLTMQSGSKAYGRAKVNVTTSQTYVLDTAMRLSDVSGNVFAPQAAYTVVPGTPDVGQLQLYASADNSYYYFLLPVIAEAVGVNSNVVEGTSLDLAGGTMANFVTAEAYETFQGGVDAETVSQLIERLPVALSHRTLDSKVSIEAVLRSPDDGNFTELQALSVQGFGDDAQLRDKHNAFGVATGGKVDIYPRMFLQPAITTLAKTGTRIAANTYSIDIASTDAPGYYAVRMVADAEAVFAPAFAFGTIAAAGGYAFTDVRSASGLQDTWHDIADSAIEVTGTVYQAGTLVVTGVPDTAETHAFKVELYVAPRLAEIQAFVDNADYRNLKADYVVRCPFMCMVSLRATVYARDITAIDTAAVIQRLQDYVNAKSFTAQLTESEIIAVLHEFDIERVNLTNDAIAGFQMVGVVRDAAGVEHTLGPRTLNIANIEDADVLITPQTCVFALESQNVSLTVRPTT